MKRSILIGIIAATISILSIIYFAPSAEDFYPNNPGWNGLSNLSLELHLKIVDRLFDSPLNPSSTTLLIMGPERNFTEQEASIIESFMRSGGTVILADDFGSGNLLLRLLDLRPRFNGSLLVDPLFMERSMKFPRIRDISGDLESAGIRELVLNYATVIEGCERPLAASSFYSFLDVNLNGVWDEGEPKGPFVVACTLKVGRGELILVADSSVGINSMLAMGDNLRFIKILSGNRMVLLDRSHWHPSRLTLAKSFVRDLAVFLSLPEVRYTAFVVVVLVIVRYKRPPRPTESEVEKVLTKNPTWNRELLIRLEREMKNEH